MNLLLRILFLVLFTSSFVFCSAENNDSLIQILTNKSLPDSVRNEAAHSLINKNIYSDPQLALKHAEIFEKCIQEEKKEEWLAENYWKKGIIYRELNDIKKATNSLFDALDLAEKNKDELLKSRVYNSLGAIYYAQDNYEKSREMFLKSLAIAKKSGRKDYLADSYINMGAIEQNMNNYDDALMYSKKALNLFLERDDLDGAAYVYSNLATLFEKQKQIDSSLHYNEKALKIFIQYNNKRGISSLYVSMGIDYFKLNKLQLAEKYCLDGYTVSKEAGFATVTKSACNCLKNVYEKTDIRKAYFYLNEFYELKDSLLNEESISENTRREEQFKYKETQIADSLHRMKEEKEKELIHEKEVQEQRFFTYIVIGVAGVTLIFLLVVYRSFQQKKRANFILAGKNELINNQKAAVEMQKEIIEEKQKEITDSINYAKRIQYSLLAHQEMLNSNLPEHFVLFKPKDIVSGDFYWCTRKENDFYLAVCDCTGHGVPGAFMSLLNISFLNEAINEKNILEPHSVLNHVRERLIVNMEGAQDGMDAVLVRLRGNKIDYAAAHNRPVLIRKGELMELPADKMPVGKGEKSDSFTLNSLELNKGDLIFFYTDGYADQFGGEKGKKFKYSSLHKLLLENSDKDLNKLCNILSEEFEKWRGELEQIDDVCIVGIRI